MCPEIRKETYGRTQLGLPMCALCPTTPQLNLCPPLFDDLKDWRKRPMAVRTESYAVLCGNTDLLQDFNHFPLGEGVLQARLLQLLR